MSTQGISITLRRRLNGQELASLLSRLAADAAKYGRPCERYGDDRGNLLCTVEVVV